MTKKTELRWVPHEMGPGPAPFYLWPLVLREVEVEDGMDLNPDPDDVRHGGVLK